jgi:protein-S-isoprenylcysteine O-methyltransferase Ste14
VNGIQLKYIFAPIGVAIGITVFISSCLFIAEEAGISNLDRLLFPLPAVVLCTIGVCLILIFFPIFFIGIVNLNRRDAVGQSNILQTNGVYAYVRNPMYSGISITIIGIGLILNSTGTCIASILWFALTFFQCRREEKELLHRFGEEYISY